MREGLPTLEELLALPPAVSLSLVISLDGQLCGHDGSSRSLSGPEDLELLRRLRAAADVVVVGTATAEREGYGPIPVRLPDQGTRLGHGLARTPELVILRRSDDFATLRSRLGPRVQLEAGVRLHTALQSHIDRIWLSHSPTMVGGHEATFGLDLQHFTLAARHRGNVFTVSRFERVSPR